MPENQPQAQQQPQPPDLSSFFDDPGYIQFIGEGIDDERTKQAAIAIDGMGLGKAAYYTPVRSTAPIGATPSFIQASAVRFASQGLNATASLPPPLDPEYNRIAVVQEGESQEQAQGRIWREEKTYHEYVLARTLSMATFGLSTRYMTDGFEKNYQEENSSSPRISTAENQALGVNLMAFPITPAGIAITKLFKVGRTLGRGVVGALSTKAGLPIARNLATSFGIWSGKLFGRAAPGPVAENLQKLVNDAGGMFLKNGKVYLPPEVVTGPKFGPIKEAINALRAETGSAVKVRVVNSFMQPTLAGQAAEMAGTTGGMIAAGTGAASAEEIVSSATGRTKEERLDALAEIGPSMIRGGTFGGKIGVPIALAEAIAMAAAGRGSAVPLGPQTTLGTNRLLSEPVWDLGTMGPAPPGWKGKVVSQ
jgi:hypothetical protein